MKKLKLVLVITIFLFVILLFFAFLSGPLFPWSPIKIGYDHSQFQRATVYFPTGTNCPSDCTTIDNMMDEVEEFHGLMFLDNMKIIFCNSWGLFERGRLSSLGLRSSGPLATTMGTGTVIYFSPGLKGSGRNLRRLLKHELSHAIRYQNTTLLNVLTYFGATGELHWLDEAVAVYFGNHSDYPDASEFKKLAVEKEYLFRIWDKNDADKIPIKKRHMFRYAEYGFFFSYLVHRFGNETVMDFVRKSNKHPEMVDNLFQSSFDISLHRVARDFEQAVHEGSWPP